MQQPHTHDELELNLVLSGSARYLLSGKTYELRAGSLLWLFPMEDHILLDCAGSFTMWVAVFKQRLLAGSASHIPELSAQNPPGSHCRQLPHKLRKSLEELLRLCHQAEADRDVPRMNAAIAHALLEAHSYYTLAADQPAPPEVHPAVEQAARILQDRPEWESIDALAREVGLSRSQLSRLFHKQIGIPLVRFRSLQRLEAFFTLYGAGRKTGMLQAALDAGFGSYPQFHRVFKENMGCGPAQYFRQRN